jgi:Plasmid encoded RepA protein
MKKIDEIIEGQKIIPLTKSATTALKNTPVKQRLIQTAAQIEMEKSTIKDAIFQHSIFCQTFFPYRNLGDAQHWEQTQGNIELRVSAGSFFNKDTHAWEITGIPYGTKSRLILMYLNSFAIQNQSKVVDVGKSMSEFIKELGLSVQGNTIREVKEQLRRIATATINLASVSENHSTQVRLELVRKIDIWFPKDERQRVLWDTSIELSTDYFESLMKHAIPLDKRAIAALSHNAMALDIYAWLVQRLHRIPAGKPQFVTWKNLKDQFGQGYTAMNHFKVAFRKSLILAKLEYMSARFSEDANKGFWLENSPTPIPSKYILMPNTTDLTPTQ